MDFRVQDGVPLDGLKAGQSIHFTMVETEQQGWQIDGIHVMSDAAETEGRTLAGIGIRPATLEAIVPTYLWRFRESGQFTNPNAPSESGG